VRLDDVGVSLRRLRSVRGLTQAEVAELAGCSRSQISDLELGKGNPTVDTLFRVLHAMGWRAVHLDNVMKEVERERRGR
jgi:transcriptional regulator with XRE-family HTH domain